MNQFFILLFPQTRLQRGHGVLPKCRYRVAALAMRTTICKIIRWSAGRKTKRVRYDRSSDLLLQTNKIGKQHRRRYSNSQAKTGYEPLLIEKTSLLIVTNLPYSPAFDASVNFPYSAGCPLSASNLYVWVQLIYEPRHATRVCSESIVCHLRLHFRVIFGWLVRREVEIQRRAQK